mmetsp:Transcript_13416/g.43723  ORF Transcript_13416/g.43723 Transcript_13416/m.43723 type:complete len:178 (+) Transcript_13416:70-603(+)
MSLSFAEYVEGVPRRLEASASSKAVFSPSWRRDLSRGDDERSRVAWERRLAAAERVGERVRQGEARELTFAPKLTRPSSASRLFRSPDPSRRREVSLEKEMAQCSFRPEIEECPDWIRTMAEASRRRRQMRRDLALEAYLRSVDRDSTTKKDLKRKLIRETIKKGRPPSPPPPWRFS